MRDGQQRRRGLVRRAQRAAAAYTRAARRPRPPGRSGRQDRCAPLRVFTGALSRQVPVCGSRARAGPRGRQTTRRRGRTSARVSRQLRGGLPPVQWGGHEIEFADRDAYSIGRRGSVCSTTSATGSPTFSTTRYRSCRSTIVSASRISWPSTIANRRGSLRTVSYSLRVSWMSRGAVSRPHSHDEPQQARCVLTDLHPLVHLAEGRLVHRDPLLSSRSIMTQPSARPRIRRRPVGG